MPRRHHSLGWIEIEKSAGEALYKQITDQIRTAITQTQLVAGTQLPSSRALAHDLRVSRITVTQAYDQLMAEGLLETRHGSGTRVAMAAGNAHALSSPPRDMYLQYINELYGDKSTNVAFQPGIPAFDEFPHQMWSRALFRAGMQRDLALLDYGHAGGYGPLRREICCYLARARGVTCDPAQIMVVTSVRAAIATAARVLLDPGAEVAVEDPGYKVARRVLARIGHAAIPVPVDAHGLQVSALRQSSCAAVYVTPAHHWPTGTALSRSRRKSLVAWARERTGWILEDDYDSEFRFESAPMRTLYARAPDQVIYIGTFSKVFAPSVRVAYLIVPQETRQAFEQAIFESAMEPALHVQAALADLLARGQITRHIARMRKLYATRRARLCSALERAFGDWLTVEAPPGGLQVLAHLPNHVASASFVAAASDADLVVRDIAENCVEAKCSNTVQMGFAAIPESLIAEVVDRLKAAVHHLF